MLPVPQAWAGTQLQLDLGPHACSTWSPKRGDCLAPVRFALWPSGTWHCEEHVMFYLVTPCWQEAFAAGRFKLVEVTQ